MCLTFANIKIQCESTSSWLIYLTKIIINFLPIIIIGGACGGMDFWHILSPTNRHFFTQKCGTIWHRNRFIFFAFEIHCNPFFYVERNIDKILRVRQLFRKTLPLWACFTWKKDVQSSLYLNFNTYVHRHETFENDAKKNSNEMSNFHDDVEKRKWKRKST